MLDKPTIYPLNSSSALLQQQERQLRQYTLAAISTRERERERASPEPHLEIMRPVSPFQNKRQLAHQQAPIEGTTQSQRQGERPLNSHYQTHSSSQTYKQSYARVVANTQQIGPSSTGTNLKPHSSAHTTLSGSRTRLNTRREASRGVRTTSRDTDISPALKMMNYDTSSATVLSDQEQGNVSTNTMGMLAPPDRSDVERSASPEGGGKRRNPGWRKPVPKYIPTPPSTPPTATIERLPSARGREEPVPPVPASSSIPNMQATRTHPAPVKAYSTPAPVSSSQSPPPRPVRSATGPEVPVMFRDLTASKTRIGTIQHPAQAHTRQNTGLSRVTTAHIRNVPQTARSARKEDASRHRAQVSAALTAPRVPPQAYTTSGGRASPGPLTRRSRSPSPQPTHERAESRQETLAHPQPRKVPSMAQLVAMVLPSRSPSRSPSRTPSPGITLSSMETTEPSTTVASSETLAETVQAPVPSLAINRPSPAVVKEESNKMCNVPPSALLQPDQVQLPPSIGSSARSSPSPSPLPSPRPAPVPLPIRSRSRSPTPAVTQQHAPPTPPLPSVPLASPTASNLRAFNLPQPVLNVRSVREREAPNSTAQVLHEPVKQTTHTSRGAHFTSDVALENLAGISTASVNTLTRAVRSPAEQPGATPVRSDSVRHELRDTETPAPQAAQQAVGWRSPSPMRHQSAQPQTITEEETHTVNDIVKEPTPAYERCVPSHNANPLFARTKEVERRVLEDDAMSIAPHDRTPPSGQLEPPIRPSVNSTSVESSQTFETCTADGPVVQDVNIPARRRPAPAPMSEHAQVSRESGLVTPPDTPPGTTTTTLNTNTEDSPVGSEERVCVAQKSDKEMEANSCPRLPGPPAPVKAPLSKASLRRRTLIQDEQPTWKDETAIEEANNTGHLTRPISSVRPIGTSAVVLEAARQETVVPPLPPDWKETITHAARSDTGPPASPPVPSQAEVEKILDVLPRTNSMAPQKAKARDATFTDKPVIREVSTHAEHETTVLEIHVHEVDTRHVIQAYQIPEKVTQKEQYLQLSSTPLRSAAPLEPVTIISPAVKPDVVQDYAASKNTLIVEASEEPVRSRSPVPRKKVPQQNQGTAIDAQERPEEPPNTTATDELQMLPKSSAQRSAVPSSRSHSSGLKRKPRTNRAQSDKDSSNIVTARSTDPFDKAEKSHLAQGAQAGDSVSSLVDGQSPANCLTPPQRLQSLGNRKRLPLNGSESSLIQHPVKDATRDDSSSPYLTGRSLPTSSQPQVPTRPPRHLHGQHKRLPAPEVTQAYRPPTPPIPSHYKKKSSNDMLPTEPPTFMKPAVHVIYPDTSTSHEHSLSGDSILYMSNFKSNNAERCQSPMGLYSTTARARSPSPAVPASEEQDDNDEVAPEAYPQVPPKTRRHEMASHGSPSSSDRPSEFAIQHATRGQIRYPSEPVGQARAHILMLPPSSNNSRSRMADNADGNFNPNIRPRQVQQPHAKKAARSHSEKVFRKNDNVKPLARSRSTPIPSSGQRNRRGFWRIFGLWARVFMAKFKTWTSPGPGPSPSQSSEYGGYYDPY